MAIGAIVILALISLAGLLADASHQTRESFRQVKHSAAVIEMIEQALGDLRDAESGQRGFVLTHNLGYAQTFDERIASASANIDQVVKLTSDNSLQYSRAREISELMRQRAAILRRPLDLGRRGDFSGALAVIASGKGRELMDALTVRVQGFLEDERALQTARGDAADQRVSRSTVLSLAGATIVALIVLVAFASSFAVSAVL